MYVQELTSVSQAQTRILCLRNSLSAVSVVPVVSLVWRGCLFYASGLCSFWQTMRAFCQSLPGKHSYNKHQQYIFFSPSNPRLRFDPEQSSLPSGILEAGTKPKQTGIQAQPVSAPIELYTCIGLPRTYRLQVHPQKCNVPHFLLEYEESWCLPSTPI